MKEVMNFHDLFYILYWVKQINYEIYRYNWT